MAVRPWSQIADTLRQEIAGSAPGARLASGTELMQRFGVARNTIQNAIDQLRAEGLVVSVSGRGWFVSERKPVIRLSRNRLSAAERAAGRGTFMSDAATGNWKPAVTVKIYREAVPADIAKYLDIEPGTDVAVRDRIMRADGETVQLAVSYIPVDIAEAAGIEKTDTGPGGMYARIEESGTHLTHYTELVSARPPRPRESEQLQIPAAYPVIEVIRVAYAGDRPIEANRMVMSSERYQLVYQIAAD
ncbi:GntR family transcriptional regulator [Fodinicola feengrottensis]|uniref:GntR family transcriptional regulator n=1 Tax=Fodinicola feengrottensis TaxID=435914 RepID=A0ABN2IL94_9ACTN|nr:GntR family transcriptional regulator [Fodinicola feengrottensis]